MTQPMNVTRELNAPDQYIPGTGFVWPTEDQDAGEDYYDYDPPECEGHYDDDWVLTSSNPGGPLFCDGSCREM